MAEAPNKDNIITDLRAALDMQNSLIERLTDLVDYWQGEAIARLDRDMRMLLGERGADDQTV